MSEDNFESANSGTLPAEDEREESGDTPREPTKVAQRLRRLHSSVLNAAARRRRLPQPLFWSLFHTELEEIRRAKERERLLRNLSS